MSGPKSSNYTLSFEQRRRILEAQRQQREREEELRRFEMESKKQNALMEKMFLGTQKLSGLIDRLMILKRESGYDVYFVDDAAKAVDHAKKLESKIKSQKPTTSKELQELNHRLSECIELLALQNSLCTDHVSEISDRFRQELDDRISAGFHLSFSSIGKEQKKRDNAQIKRINELLAELSGITLSDSLLDRLKEIKAKADSVTDPAFLKSFHEIVIIPFVKKCKEYEAVCAEHDELLIRYAILAAECGVDPHSIPYTQEGVESLKEEIARLEQLSLEQKEKEYIKVSLDEAMREMGYDLVGDRVVTKRSGKRIRHELYSLDNGTAVDVTYSENGQISMELGGLDYTDRQPDAAESAQLVEDMRSFCSDYDALAKRLAEKGIQTRRVSVMPPSPEYAQIINANDYAIHKNITAYSAAIRKKKPTSTRYRES